MLLLTSTSDIIRVVTGTAVSTITVHASWVDNASGTITPGRTNTNITTATTTTIVASPGASTQRNVKTIGITNNNASTSTTVTVQHFDGTTSTDLMGVTLLPGENLYLLEDGDWQHHNAQGAEYGYTAPAQGSLGPTGAIAETIPRALATTNSTIGASGTLFLQSVYLTAGQIISNIGMISATTAAATTSNLQFGLYSSALALLATSANQSAYTWAANTAKTLAMASAYTVQQSGLYYIGVNQNATTIATLHGGPAKANAIVASTAPILHGTSSTGLTTALPSTAAAITAGTASLYAWVT
jgi:hypothetical protein